MSRSRQERERAQAIPHAGELAMIIDKAAADKPSMSVLLDRLEGQGIEVVPSIQSSGRLNGFTFRYKGQTIKASTLGREYTPQGLQQRKGVSYDQERDKEALVHALARA